MLREERAAHAHQVAELEAYSNQLEAELAAEMKRRLAGQLRALIEGARFIVHKQTAVQERHIWYRYKHCFLCGV